MRNTFKEWVSKCQDGISKSSIKVASFVGGGSVSVLAMQLQSSAEVDTTVSNGLSTWTSIISTVWTIIIGNPLLSSLATACLLFIGFKLFRTARR